MKAFVEFFRSKAERARKKLSELESLLETYKLTFRSYEPEIIKSTEKFIRKSKDEIAEGKIENDLDQKIDSYLKKLTEKMELYEKYKEILPILIEIVLLRKKRDHEVSPSSLTEIVNQSLREEAIDRYMDSEYG
jgi:hypothetical protein